MPEIELKESFSSCRGDCNECSIAEQGDGMEAPYAGSKLATASLVTFLSPLLLAILLGAWANSPELRLLGAFSGFILGFLVAQLYAKLFPGQHKT